MKVISEQAEAYRIWKSSGVKDRILLHLGSRPGLTALADTAGLPYPGSFPIRVFGMVGEYEKRLGGTDYLWIGAQADLIREVRVAVAAPDRDGLLASLIKNTRLEGDTVFLIDLPILILPPGLRGDGSDEPVLLDIDPTYFRHGMTAEKAYREISKVSLHFDIATVWTGAGDAAITEDEKREASAFAALLEKAGK